VQCERGALIDALKALQTELQSLQGEQPLLMASVDAQGVAAVVSSWTGIPVGRMLKNEVDTVLRLADVVGERVVGQRHALDMIARRIQSSRAGLDHPNKPVGVFLLVGPSGVGKTETALALADALYGGEQNLITINMSEFQEPHSVSTLKGAPPGYVGYGEGGVLTEAVRRRPYSVVLLDEVEKAHPDVHELFFQVFDKGWMEDGEGRRIDFRNTLILLTSNVGSESVARLCADAASRPAPQDVAQALRRPLLEVFPAALLGRLVTVPYYALDAEQLGSIVRLQLRRIERQLLDRQGVALELDPAVTTLIASRCTELESGARMIDNLLTNSLLPGLSRELLTRTLEGCKVERARVCVEAGEFRYTFR
jgi:type VI secretion system protein VasG